MSKTLALVVLLCVISGGSVGCEGAPEEPVPGGEQEAQNPDPVAQEPRIPDPVVEEPRNPGQGEQGPQNPEQAEREPVYPEETDRKIKPRTAAELPPGLAMLFAQYAQAFVTETQADRAVFAAELFSRLRAGEALYVVDVRDQASFQRGHVPSAINLPIEILFTPEVLEAFPADGTPVVLVCANGHVSSMAAGLLGTMGHNAYSLRFGMIGWPRATQVQVYSSSQVPQTINGLNAPLER